MMTNIAREWSDIKGEESAGRDTLEPLFHHEGFLLLSQGSRMHLLALKFRHEGAFEGAQIISGCFGYHLK